MAAAVAGTRLPPSCCSSLYACEDTGSDKEKPSAGIMHRRDFIGSRNAGIVAAVSDLALLIGGPDTLLAHNGMSPHRIRDISRLGFLGFWRIVGTGWVGAML
jgi:hypothetical protein